MNLGLHHPGRAWDYLGRLRSLFRRRNKLAFRDRNAGFTENFLCLKFVQFHI
jgi:hypothetical protein